MIEEAKVQIPSTKVEDEEGSVSKTSASSGWWTKEEEVQIVAEREWERKIIAAASLVMAVTEDMDERKIKRFATAVSEILDYGEVTEGEEKRRLIHIVAERGSEQRFIKKNEARARIERSRTRSLDYTITLGKVKRSSKYFPLR